MVLGWCLKKKKRDRSPKRGLLEAWRSFESRWAGLCGFVVVFFLLRTFLTQWNFPAKSSPFLTKNCPAQNRFKKTLDPLLCPQNRMFSWSFLTTKAPDTCSALCWCRRRHVPSSGPRGHKSWLLEVFEVHVRLVGWLGWIYLFFFVLEVFWGWFRCFGWFGWVLLLGFRCFLAVLWGCFVHLGGCEWWFWQLSGVCRCSLAVVTEVHERSLTMVFATIVCQYWVLVRCITAVCQDIDFHSESISTTQAERMLPKMHLTWNQTKDQQKAYTTVDVNEKGKKNEKKRHMKGKTRKEKWQEKKSRNSIVHPPICFPPPHRRLPLDAKLKDSRCRLGTADVAGAAGSGKALRQMPTIHRSNSWKNCHHQSTKKNHPKVLFLEYSVHFFTKRNRKHPQNHPKTKATKISIPKRDKKFLPKNYQIASSQPSKLYQKEKTVQKINQKTSTSSSPTSPQPGFLFHHLEIQTNPRLRPQLRVQRLVRAHAAAQPEGRRGVGGVRGVCGEEMSTKSFKGV